MSAIDPRVVVHKLNVNSALKPIKQKKRNFTPERNQVVAEDVEKLLAADFVRSLLPRLVSQCGDGTEAEQKMANVCRLHRLEQNMLKG